MKKSQRMNRLHKLMKLQEQAILAEYKQLQAENLNIKQQISDLHNHSKNSITHTMQDMVGINELTMVRKFSEKVEVVIEQLQVTLDNNDKNYMIVADKVKNLRASLTAIERLSDKHLILENYQDDLNEQKQIDENTNHKISSYE